MWFLPLMLGTLHIHQSFFPCIHGDIEQLSQYVHFQMTELMNWRGGCSAAAEVRGSQSYSILAVKTLAKTAALHFSFPSPLHSPSFLILANVPSHLPQFPSLLSSSPRLPQRVILSPPTAISPFVLGLVPLFFFFFSKTQLSLHIVSTMDLHLPDRQTDR